MQLRVGIVIDPISAEPLEGRIRRTGVLRVAIGHVGGMVGRCAARIRQGYGRTKLVTVIIAVYSSAVNDINVANQP